MWQVYMLSLSSQPVDHEEPGKQMVLGDQVSFQYRPGASFFFFAHDLSRMLRIRILIRQ